MTGLTRRRVSRAAAFTAQGVALKYPASSWSGVRSDDCMVVFAFRAEDVISDRGGSRCLLWAPSRADSPAGHERLKHCMLALGHGQAEGMLAFLDGTEIDPALILPLRVERHHGGYWAKWGSVSSVLPLRPHRAAGWAIAPERALAALS